MAYAERRERKKGVRYRGLYKAADGRYRSAGTFSTEKQALAVAEEAERHAAEVAATIIKVRRRYGYGAQTLRDFLMQQHPESHWPAASSIGALLEREHLIRRKRRRSRSAERSALDAVRTPALEPNMVWTADFKGEFRLGLVGEGLSATRAVSLEALVQLPTPFLFTRGTQS